MFSYGVCQTISTVSHRIRSFCYTVVWYCTMSKKRFLCEYRSTDDIKQKKQKTENKTTPNKTTIGVKQYKYNALRYLQKDPKTRAGGGGGVGGVDLLESLSHHILSLKPVSQSFFLLGSRTKLLSLAEWS